MLIKTILLLSVLIALGICFLAGSFAGLGWLWVLPVSFVGAFVVLVGLAFLYLYILCSRVDTSVPQEHDDPFYRKVAYLYCEAICTLLRMKVHAVGLEKTPMDGRFLLVCNHLFELDPVVLYACFQKSQLAFISKRENNAMFMVGKLMHRLMAQLINRENDREALKTILKCVQLIKDDEVSIAVFPEGYIHDDRKFHHFRNGVFKIAQKANVPIVVCTMTNTADSISNLLHLKPSHIDLHLLEVIPAQELQGVNTAQIGQRIYDLMAADLGPENISDDE